MAGSVNKVILIGNLGRDPETRTFQSGGKVCNLRPVRVLGKKYESIKAAERDLGLSSGTVRYWLKFNPARAQLIKEEASNVVCK